MATDAYGSVETVLTATPNTDVFSAVPANHTYVIQKIMVCNTDVATNNVTLNRYSGSSHRPFLTGAALDPSGTLEISGPMIIEAGGKITGNAGVDDKVFIFVDYLDHDDT